TRTVTVRKGRKCGANATREGHRGSFGQNSRSARPGRTERPSDSQTGTRPQYGTPETIHTNCDTLCRLFRFLNKVVIEPCSMPTISGPRRSKCFLVCACGKFVNDWV